MATAAVTLPKLRRRPVNPLAAGRASFYFTKDIDNSRLVRVGTLEKWREYVNLLILGMLVFLLALFFSWQHLQCVQDGYEIESLKTERAKLQEWNHQLKLSQAKLSDPERISALAGDIGMVPPSPTQVIQWGGADVPSK